MILRKFVSNTSKISLYKPNYFDFTKLKRLKRKTKFFLSFFLINVLNFLGRNFWWKEKTSTFAIARRDGRVVECGGLENRCTARYRGFESLSLRNTRV